MAETFIPDHKFDANDLRAIGALSATDLEVIDHARMAACKPRWLKLAMVVGEAIHACPEKYHDVPDIFYSQRVRELVKTVRSIDKMSAVSVQITRFVNDHFPGFVECVLSDALGKNHAFVEKAPICEY